MYGSVLPQVTPFCLVNVAWTLLIQYLKTRGIIDLTFQSMSGHQLMAILVSFLVVSRCSISYNRYMEMRRHLSEAYMSCRELNQYSCIYTLSATSMGAQEWRREVAFRTILMLRVTMDALHWSSTQTTMETESLAQEQAHTRQKDEPFSSQHMKFLRSYVHGLSRTTMDQNFRAPLVLSYNLRKAIMCHEEGLGYKLSVNEYRDLLMFVTSYVKAFHGFRVIVFTPYPFSLVQMTRIFIFFWVYSLPLVLLEQLKSIYSCVLLVFFITFGFLGIEYVSMSLDHPFGDDPVHFDDQAMAEIVYEDIYLSLYKTDGRGSVEQLRKQILERYREGSALENFRNDINQDEFWDRTV